VPLRVRAGVATGELIAGIVPGSRMSFDVWGECVGVANRLCALATPGMVLCCERTHREAVYHLEFDAPRRYSLSVEKVDDRLVGLELIGALDTYRGGGVPMLKSARFGIKS